MIFAFVAENRDRLGTRRLCELMGVSRSGFYAWLTRPASAHRQHDERLKAAIRELHQGFRRAYGAARVHQALRQNGLSCSRRRINRLMREMGIKAASTGLYTWQPGRQAFYSATGNHLKLAGEPDAVGEQWAGDFTYIKTRSGWLYCAVVIDLYSRRVVGWSLNTSRNAELTQSALRMAWSRARPKPGCIFHSDQGIEYASHDFARQLEQSGLLRSMSKKGNPLDNATVESFFHSLKAELIHHKTFTSAVEAAAHIIEYIEFYNRERLHSALGYQSPEKYERLCA